MSKTAALDANIASHLGTMAAARPSQLAVLFPEARARDGRIAHTHLTYAQLDHEAHLTAEALGRSGIRAGDRVVLMVPPSLPFFALTFALFRMRAIPVFVDPGMGLRNLKRCLADAAPQAFVGVAKAHLARVVLGWERGTLQQKIVVGPGRLAAHLPGVQTLELDRKQTRFADTVAANPEDLAAILFTSGSTGTPKGAIYTHANFQAQVALLKETYAIAPGEIDLCTFPLFALFAPALGMTAVVPDMDFTRPAAVVPEKIFDAIADFGVTNLFGSPALLKRLAARGAELGTTLPTLRRVISAGAPVSARILAALQPMLAEGVEIFTPYGATEALPVASLGSRTILSETARRTDEGRGICVGRPVAGVDVKIIAIDEAAVAQWHERLALPAGVIGEIVVRGPQVTKAYYGKADATAKAKLVDPRTGEILHRMGDLGYFDQEGRLWFCGRKSHRLGTAFGELYTIPCEGVFNTHAAVYRTALVGRGARGTMEPVLCVEPQRPLSKGEQSQVRKDLLQMGGRFQHTTTIRDVRFFKALPVDTRHNAKIFREKLKVLVDGGRA